MLSLRHFKLNRFSRTSIIGAKSLFSATVQFRTDYSTSAEAIDSNIDYKHFNSVNISGKHRDLINNMFFWSKCVTEGKQSLQELLEDKEFSTLCATIVNSVEDIENMNLILLLQSLLVMGLDSNTRVVCDLDSVWFNLICFLSIVNWFKGSVFGKRNTLAFEEYEPQKVVEVFVISLQISINWTTETSGPGTNYENSIEFRWG